MEENGPWSPALIRAVARVPGVDFLIFYSYRYCQTFFGLPLVASRAILVPTAEEDPAVRLPIFRNLFRAPQGILYLTPEEHDLIVAASGGDKVPSTVIGSGVDVPEGWRAVNVEQRFGLSGDYVLYVGRIDRNKGVDSLFHYYGWLTSEWPEAPPLILVGNPVLPIPKSPKIRHLGFLSDEEKYALISGCTVLLMPSRYESLAIVVLEAWAMGRPILANGACRVLEGQCRRSGGGLLYRDYAEFRIALRLLVQRPDLRRGLGESGRQYVHREANWNVVEARTNGFLEEMSTLRGGCPA